MIYMTSRLFEVRLTLFSNPCTDLFQRMICSRKETIGGSETSCIGATPQTLPQFQKNKIHCYYLQYQKTNLSLTEQVSRVQFLINVWQFNIGFAFVKNSGIDVS